jgi:hypothetical protein
MAADVLEEIAGLLGDLGSSYQRGRRYRAINAACEERYLTRALTIGSTVRRASRQATLDASALGALRDELRALAAACEADIARVRNDEPYRAAVAAWEAGRLDEVADAATRIFTAVELYRPCPTLYHPVPITQRGGGREHFVSPAACAETIVDLQREGLVAARTPPELGADDVIRAVVLTDDPETGDSPIALAVDPGELPFPVCHVVPGGDVLIYAGRVAATFRVRVASTVMDEWWNVRPDEYRAYVENLHRELDARGLTVASAVS